MRLGASLLAGVKGHNIEDAYEEWSWRALAPSEFKVQWWRPASGQITIGPTVDTLFLEVVTLSAYVRNNLRLAMETYQRPFLVRINQEANGDPDAFHAAGAWRGWSSPQYRAHFAEVTDILKNANPYVRTLSAPVGRGRGRADEVVEYTPDAADVVGFTRYSRGGAPIPEQWDASIRALRQYTARELVVSEFGRLRGTSNRRRWLRGLRDVNVDGAIYFDMKPPGEPVDWRMGPRMARLYGRMIRNG